MIEKHWSTISPNYDEQFDRISDNMWSVWKTECALAGTSYFNKPQFIKRFGYEPIENMRRTGWMGLLFEDDAAYVLFMMEWS